MIAVVKPDIVIEENVERLIKRDMPDFTKNTPEFFDRVFADKFERLNDVIFSIKNSDARKDVTYNPYLKLHEGESGLSFEVIGDDPQLYLPPVDFKNDGSYLMRVVIDSSVDTTLTLFYQTTKEKKYTAEHNVNRKIKTGRNTVYLPLLFLDLDGRLRLDPECSKGEFHIEDIEIRSFPAGKIL